MDLPGLAEPHSRLSAQESDLTVVLLAAGRGTRLGAGMPKALVPVAGEPILVHALRRVRRAFPHAPVVVVIPPGDTALAEAAEHAGLSGGLRCVPGGAERADSVRNALSEVRTSRVLIHDSARALTPPQVFASVAEALAQGAEAVIPAVEVVDTIKEWDRATGTVLATPDRSSLRSVQTPQGFSLQQLKEAHERRLADPYMPEATDDAMLMELMGHEVRVVPGHEQALKITRAVDLVLAQHYLNSEEPSA